MFFGRERVTENAITLSSEWYPVAQEVVNLVKQIVVVGIKQIVVVGIKLIVNVIILRSHYCSTATLIEAEVNVVTTSVNLVVNKVSNVVKIVRRINPYLLIAAPIHASTKLLVEWIRPGIKSRGYDLR